MEVNLTKIEIEKILENLEQCYSEGYLCLGDPTFKAIIKLEEALGKICGCHSNLIEEKIQKWEDAIGLNKEE